MKKLDDYQKYLPILSKAKLFEGIPLEHYPQIFNFLQASILSFEKDELIQHLENLCYIPELCLMEQLKDHLSMKTTAKSI